MSVQRGLIIDFTFFFVVEMDQQQQHLSLVEKQNESLRRENEMLSSENAELMGMKRSFDEAVKTLIHENETLASQNAVL